MELHLLTAALQAAGDGRRAAAGMSGADIRTAGTETQFPAGTHKDGCKNRHGAIRNLEKPDDVQRERRRWSAIGRSSGCTFL